MQKKREKMCFWEGGTVGKRANFDPPGPDRAVRAAQAGPDWAGPGRAGPGRAGAVSGVKSRLVFQGLKSDRIWGGSKVLFLTKNHVFLMKTVQN